MGTGHKILRSRDRNGVIPLQAAATKMALSQKWFVLVSLVAAAYFASPVFIPFFSALFLAMLLSPTVDRLARLGMPRALGSLLVFCSFIVVTAAACWLIYGACAELALALPSYSEKLHHFYEALQTRVAFLNFDWIAPPFRVGDAITRVEIVDRFPAWAHILLRGVGSAYGIISLLLFVPLLLLYFLIEKNTLVESSNSLIGSHYYLPKLHSDLPSMVRAFVVGNVVTGLVLSVAQAVILLALGFDNWLPLGLISGFLNLVPILGTPLAIALPFLQSLVQFDSAWPAIAMSALFLATHFVGNNMILPQIVGARINISSSALIIGLLFWGWLWGAVGFLLAIPMTALVKILLESNKETVVLGNLFAAKPKSLFRLRDPSLGPLPRKNSVERPHHGTPPPTVIRAVGENAD